MAKKQDKARSKLPSKAKPVIDGKRVAVQELPIGKLKANPKNPRILRDEKFLKLKKSIEEFPDMLNYRTLVAVTEGDHYMVLGGNMRLRAMQDLKHTTVPVMLADHWTKDQRERFIIADNIGFGEWDLGQLANEWDAAELSDWGMDFPGAEVAGVDAPELSDALKPEYQQMTFTLHDSQVETVKAAMERAKASGADSEVNENSNGNALAYIAATFING